MSLGRNRWQTQHTSPSSSSSSSSLSLLLVLELAGCRWSPEVEGTGTSVVVGVAFFYFFAGVVWTHVCGASWSRGCLLGDIRFPWIAGGDFLLFVVNLTEVIVLFTRKLSDWVWVSVSGELYILAGVVWSGVIFVLSNGEMPAFRNADIKLSGANPLLYALLLMAATL